MSTATRIYFDFINNLFCYLFTYEFIKNALHITAKKRTHVFLIAIEVLYAIPESIPHQRIIGLLLTLFSTFILCYPHLKKIPRIFISSYLIHYVGQFIIYFIYTLIMLDAITSLDNPYYAYFKDTLCTTLVYIIYMLYINGKRMRQLQKRYHYLFTFVILSISLTLGYLTLHICKAQEIGTPVIPVLFSVLLILIAICINIYHHFINAIEENAHARILIKHNDMTANYSRQIERNLKELHSLRHDIRNHLITIDGYAKKEEYSSICKYISDITEKYTDVPLFDTPSDVVSSLLNAKYQEACKSNIKFSIHYDFPNIYIDDFSIITILGNLIDNAITAAGKCPRGWISLDMIQANSYLNICIKNNHIEDIKEKNGIFQSSKNDTHALHGLGIKNIRSTINKLNGQINIEYTDNEFSVDILIPNY